MKKSIKPDSLLVHAVLEAAEEAECRNPMSTAAGFKMPESGYDWADADDRSDGERMVYEGVAEAEYDIQNQSSQDDDPEEY